MAHRSLPASDRLAVAAAADSRSSVFRSATHRPAARSRLRRQAHRTPGRRRSLHRPSARSDNRSRPSAGSPRTRPKPCSTRLSRGHGTPSCSAMSRNAHDVRRGGRLQPVQHMLRQEAFEQRPARRAADAVSTGRPNRVRHPTDRSATSGCSPPCLAAAQLPSVSKPESVGLGKDSHLRDRCTLTGALVSAFRWTCLGPAEAGHYISSPALES